MKLQIYAGFVIVSLLGGCAGKPPYEIIERKEEAQGFVVSYRVGVPDSYTRDNLQNWCSEITQSEGDAKAVNIEFVYANRRTQQQALCLSGKLMTIAELNQMPTVPQSVP